MKILVVNDDGYKASGICTLAEKLSLKHEVTVVAPDRERSCSAHAITFHGLKIKKIKRNYTCYRLNGTPCDCAKYGLLMLLPDADCVVSGINTTVNAGSDCVYSGTVNAAHEATFVGKKAIAVSAEVGKGDYGYAAEFIDTNLEALLTLCVQDTFISVNIPSADRDKIKGVKITKCGQRRYNDRYEKIRRKRGKHLVGEVSDVQNDTNTDVIALQNGYISVSPLKLLYYTDENVIRDVKLCL